VARPFGLTHRELDVATLVALGWPNKQIARQLVLQHGSVKSHLGAIFRKLGVDNRTAAALLLRDVLPR
jgi:DNA-binding NarL/FixJ family response regulator